MGDLVIERGLSEHDVLQQSGYNGVEDHLRQRASQTRFVQPSAPIYGLLRYKKGLARSTQVSETLRAMGPVYGILWSLPVYDDCLVFGASEDGRRCRYPVAAPEVVIMRGQESLIPIIARRDDVRSLELRLANWPLCRPALYLVVGRRLVSAA